MLISAIALRVEWSKAKARAERWAEDISIVSTEMSRSLDHVRHEAATWRRLANDIAPRPNLHSAVGDASAFAEGRRAYAFERSILYDDLGNKWAAKFTKVIKSAKKSSFSNAVRDLGSRARETSRPVYVDLRDERPREEIEEGAEGFDEAGQAADREYI